MSAREKLNVAYLNGCLIAAAVFGVLLQSWIAFLIALIVGVVCALHAGDIRPTRRKRR